jgi:hypothetical protein
VYGHQVVADVALAEPGARRVAPGPALKTGDLDRDAGLAVLRDREVGAMLANDLAKPIVDEREVVYGCASACAAPGDGTVFATAALR